MKLSNTQKRRREQGRLFSDAELRELEAENPEGFSVQEIVALFVERGARLSEASFRKYVQLGLLPRSTRVGRKGKHQGSVGRYPATTPRQLVRLKALMAQGFTIEEIQRDFLFVRGDIEALTEQLSRIFDALDDAAMDRALPLGSGQASSSSQRVLDPLIDRAITEARHLGGQLVTQLEEIEERLTLRARMARAPV